MNTKLRQMFNVGTAVSFLLVSVLSAGAQSRQSVIRNATPELGVFLPASPVGASVSNDATLAKGWPVDLGLSSAGYPYTPSVYDADGDGAAEIFVTGGETFGLRGDGSFLPGWPTVEMTYMGYGTNDGKPGPSIADLDGDGDKEIVWALRDWWAGNSYMWSFNGRNFDGSNLPHYPQYAPDDYSNALDVPFVVGDTDGDGDLESWTAHTLGNNFVFYRVSAFDHTGQRLFTRDLPTSESVVCMYFGDIDGDGTREMFALAWAAPNFILHVFQPDGSEKPGYPVTILTIASGSLMFGPPMPVDLDGDGDLEIIFGHWASKISYANCRHHDGTAYPGFPIQIATNSQLLFLGLGDLTDDGYPELIALDNWYAGTERVYVLDIATGTPLPGWPYETGAWPHSFPIVADIDGNGYQDVVVSTHNGDVIALDRTGKVLPGFPLSMHAASIAGVAVGDIDGDGLFELVSSTTDGWVYAWDVTGSSKRHCGDWPTRGINAHNTGVFGDHYDMIGDLNCDGVVDFGDINPFVLALTSPGGYQTAFPYCSMRNGDINADHVVDFGDINPFVRLLTQP